MNNPDMLWSSLHGEDCNCASCHVEWNHEWEQWKIYPACMACEYEMEQWIEENIDDPWNKKSNEPYTEKLHASH